MVLNKLSSSELLRIKETLKKDILTEMRSRGGKIGGKRSLETMTPEERSERAKKAVRAREEKKKKNEK